MEGNEEVYGKDSNIYREYFMPYAFQLDFF